MTSQTSTESIAEQVTTFNEGFTEQIGPRLSAVFADEQQGLNAAGVPDGAVAAGDVLPDAPLVSTDGSPTTLHEAIGDRPAIVVFFRGAWCPYCNITLKTYQRDLLPQLNERGIALVAISPQTPQASTQTVENGDLGFAVLADPGNALIARLGILTEPTAAARAAHTDLGFDVADSNADATGGIPFPTVLVVDAGRTVRFADVHVDYTTRTEVPKILTAADAL